MGEGKCKREDKVLEVFNCRNTIFYAFKDKELVLNYKISVNESQFNFNMFLSEVLVCS